MMSIETMLGATVEELRAIADDESLSGAYKDSLYTAADWVVAAIERITSLEQDNQEQRRLNAMGAEREARLMARVKELEKFKTAYEEWQDKTEWVQETATAKELGMHRADVMKKRIAELEKDAERFKWCVNQYGFADFIIHDIGKFCDTPEQMRQAIDTAMQKD